MTKAFHTPTYKAKLNEGDLMWDVYKGNDKVAVIYDDSREIRFTNTETSHHLAELTELRELINEISRQYIKLND